jgi:hypothetical protein
MSWRALAFAFSSLAALTLCDRVAVGGTVTTPLQTGSIPMTPTDWGVGTGGLTDPLTFAQFDPGLGTLTGVAITLSTTIHNDYELRFPQTPIPTTLYVATTATTDPSVLANSSLVSQLTDGPTVTLLGPNGLTPIFAAPGTTQPVDVVTLTKPNGTWSSLLPVTDPHFIPPSNATLSFSTTLDASNSPSLFGQFIGTGTIAMPVTAEAQSSFYSSSGNGGGLVLTSADAVVTIQYQYTPFAPPFVSPEPSGLVLLGLGAGLGLLAAGRARRAARPGSRGARAATVGAMVRGVAPCPGPFD